MPAAVAREAVTASDREAFTGLVGLGVLVFLVHSSGWIVAGSRSPAVKAALAAIAAAWVASQLLFVLVGYRATSALLDAAGAGEPLRSSYIRGALRIVPLYWVFLAGAFWLAPLAAPSAAWSATVHARQWWYWGFAGNWVDPYATGIGELWHFYVLDVAVQFLVLWPIAVRLLPRRALLALCVALVAVTPLLRLTIRLAGMPADGGYQFVFCRWDAPAVGALLVLMTRGEAGRAWLERRVRWIAAGSLAAVVALAGWERGFHQNDIWVQVVGQSLIALLCAALVWACVAGSSRAAAWTRKAVSAGWLRLAGRYGYGLFVFHFTIQLLLSRRFTSLVDGADSAGRLVRLVAYLVVVAGLSLAAGAASWWLIEQPFVRLGERLAPRRPLAGG